MKLRDGGGLQEVDYSIAVIKARNLAALKRLVFPVNGRDELGWTPLFAACYFVWLPGVVLLISRGAELSHCAPWRGGSICTTVLGVHDQLERAVSESDTMHVLDAGVQILERLCALKPVTPKFQNRCAVPVSYLRRFSAYAAEAGKPAIADLLWRGGDTIAK